MNKLLLLGFFGLAWSLPGQATSRGNGAPPSPGGASSPSAADLEQLYLSAPTGKPPSLCIQHVITAARSAHGSRSKVPLKNILSVGTEPLCVDWLILSSDQFQAARKADVKPLLEQAEKAAIMQVKAVAQQEGSSSGTGGSTNVTAKALTSKVLSIATEYGALTQSTNQQTTTASGSVGGVPAALHRQGYFSECTTRILANTPCLRYGVLDQLSRISYSISFPSGAVSSTTVATPAGSPSGTAQQVTTASQNHSVTAFGFKWVAIPTPLSRKAIQATMDEIGKNPNLEAMGKASSSLADIQFDPTFQTWLSAEADALGALADRDASGRSVLDQWEKLGTALVSAMDAVANNPSAETPATVMSSASALATAYNKQLGAEEMANLTQELAQPPVLSVSYDDNRPTGQPSNSVVRAIFQKTFEKKADNTSKPIATLTINGAVSFYNSNQNDVPGAGYLRDSQFAGEIAHDFSANSSALGQLSFTVSSAAYYQFQSSPAILNVTPGAPVDGVTFVGLPSTATKAFASKGNLGLWQLKMSTGSASGFKVPLSVTYSNRTELIAKPTWKAQIGVSYDFDSLFSK